MRALHLLVASARPRSVWDVCAACRYGVKVRWNTFPTPAHNVGARPKVDAALPLTPYAAGHRP
eukprot:5637940-Alexandrium_andersonii.AAC.1